MIVSIPSLLERIGTGATNVAASLDAFVGRIDELTGLLRATAGPGARLVTLVGPGGVGKTRLAREFSRQVLDRFDAGAWFCDLSAARNRDDALGVVAGVVGAPAANTDDDAARLGRILGSRGSLLLILDNLEQFRDEAADLTEGWLAQAPSITIVATSREPLGIPGEYVIHLDSLPAHDAIALFNSRASARWSGWDTTRERGDVEALVEALDGLPLAIEMTAAHIQVLRPAEMAARLDERFRLLVGSRRRPERHQTLRATLDWSWELLEPWERSALVQLSTFRGGFTLDAAEAVLDLSEWEDPPPRRPRRPFVAPPLAAAPSGGRWTSPVRPLRQRAGLRPGEARQPRRTGRARPPRHVLRRPRLPPQRAPRAGRRQPRPGGVVGSQVGAPRDGRPGRRRGVGGVRPPGSPEGRGHAGAGAAGQALEIANELGDARRIAREHAGLGVALSRIFHLEEARTHLEAAMAAAKEIGERDIADKCLGDLGIVARKADQWERAAELYERALQATRASGHLRQEGIVLSNLAALELDRCHLREARELLNEARTIHRAVGEARSEAIALANLSSMELTVGRPTEALLRADEMMAILATVEHPVLARSLARVRGDALRYLGRREEAAEIWNATLEGARLVTNPVTEAEALCALAALKSEGGAPAEGRPLAAEAAAIARATGIPRALASALLESGDIELADGAFDEAEAFFAEALGILEPIDHTIDLARSRIGVARAAVGLGRTEEARETEALAREAIATVGAGPESPVGRALAALHRELGSGALPLRVDEDVTWVEPPGGERIAMARKAILRRVLRCLVRARGDRPGEHVDLDTLPTAAWPNDRSDRDAMANRLYVAIHALRKLGLDAVLLSRGDGYLLDPHVPLKVNSPRS